MSSGRPWGGWALAAPLVVQATRASPSATHVAQTRQRAVAPGGSIGERKRPRPAVVDEQAILQDVAPNDDLTALGGVESRLGNGHVGKKEFDFVLPIQECDT